MTFQIQDIILHQINYNDNSGYQLQLREQPIQVNASHLRLLEELVRVHRQRNQIYAQFAVSEESSDVVVDLQHYFDKQMDFLSWSHQMVQRLSQLLTNEPRVIQQSVVLFCRYRQLTADYLLVAFVESQQSTRITESLEVQDIQYLNVAQTDKVMILDVTQWRSMPELARYFALSTGRVGRRVADFFIEWWQLNESVNAKQQTKELIKAVNQYCAQSELSEQESKVCKQQVYDYCETQFSQEKDVVIKELSEKLIEQLPDTATVPLDHFIKQQGYILEENFPTVKNLLKQLKVYKGSTKDIAIRFEADLLGEQVIWNAIEDQLIITGLPSSLRKQLIEQKPVNETAGIVLDE